MPIARDRQVGRAGRLCVRRFLGLLVETRAAAISPLLDRLPTVAAFQPVCHASELGVHQRDPGRITLNGHSRVDDLLVFDPELSGQCLKNLRRVTSSSPTCRDCPSWDPGRRRRPVGPRSHTGWPGRLVNHRLPYLRSQRRSTSNESNRDEPIHGGYGSDRTRPSKENLPRYVRLPSHNRYETRSQFAIASSSWRPAPTSLTLARLGPPSGPTSCSRRWP